MKRAIVFVVPAVLLATVLLLGGPAIRAAEAQPSTFLDVAETSPAYAAIEFLAGQGIMSGDATGHFFPNDPISRGEAATILVKWRGQEGVSVISQFSDVDAGLQPYVDAALVNGWITGYPDGTFRPDRPLTREQMITMVIRSLGLEPQARALSEWQISATLDRFLDEVAVSQTARPYLALAVRNNLVSGDAGRLYPLNVVTKAQLAMVVLRAQSGSQAETTSPATIPGEETAPDAQSQDAPSQDAVITLTPEDQVRADFMTTYLFQPHNSPITGEMVLHNVDWYGIPALPQLVIMAAETSLGDPALGGSLARHFNFGCMRYHGASTAWGVLANARIWVAGKDWYSFPDAATGMAAFGRYLKVGVNGFYVPILNQPHPDWEAFAAVYYGRGVSGFSAYVSRLRAIESKFRSMAADQGVSL